MNLWKYVVLREDLFDKDLDTAVAPSLSEVVLGNAPKIYVDPIEFISTTHITDTMRRLVEEIIQAFARGKGEVVILPSAFGGGKTHTMILLYHLIKNLDLLTKIIGERGREFIDILKSVLVVVIDGINKETAPSPLSQEVLRENNLVIKTLWGYIAYKLGKYSEIANYDESMISPEKNVFSNIIGDKRVLILIDELGFYYDRLSKAPRMRETEFLRDYARQVVVFLRTLTECAKDKNLVVIISIPAEPGIDKLKPEAGYEDFIHQLDREILRSAVRAEKPIATDEDFVNILRKRLFKEIGMKGSQYAAKRYSEIYRNYKNYLKDIVEDIKSNYPFHPYFIKVLREIVERNKDLQKTRDALRITRKIVRYLYEKISETGEEQLFIMPSNIDPGISELRQLIITQSYHGFDHVLDKVIYKVKEIPVPEDIDASAYRDLAYRLAIYVLLRTYLYDPTLEPRSEFPVINEVITAVYDPLKYEKYGINPLTASDLLDKTSRGEVEYRIPHMYSRDGYYWFTKLIDLEERIKMRSEKVDETIARNLIYHIIQKLYTTPYDVVYKRKISVEYKSEFFKTIPHVVTDLKPLDLDEQSYHLITLAQPISEILRNEELERVEECIKQGECESGPIYDFIYYKVSGSQRGPRRFANTIVLLFSDRRDIWTRIVTRAKMIIACDEVEKELEREISDKSVLKYISNELDTIKSNHLKALAHTIITSYYTYVAYPSIKMKHKTPVKIVKVSPVRISGNTLLEAVEEALKGLAKIVDKSLLRNYVTLTEILGIDEKWNKQISVRDIISAFYENPGLRFVNPEDVKYALLDGLRSLKIGVMRDNTIYFIPVEGLDYIDKLRDNDIIIPAEDAAERQIDLLKEIEEFVVGDEIVRKYYVAIIDNKEIPIHEIKARYGESYLDVLIASKIKKREEHIRTGFDISVDKNKYEFDLNEAPKQLQVKVLVKRIGKFQEYVKLDPSTGIVEPCEKEPDYEAIWTIPIPNEPGEYVFNLRGSSRDGRLIREITIHLILRKGPICIDKPIVLNKILMFELESETYERPISELLGFINKYVKGVKTIEECIVRVYFRERETDKRLIEVMFKDATIDDLIKVMNAFRSVYGLIIDLRYSKLKLKITGEGLIEDPQQFYEKVRVIGDVKTRFCY